MSSGFYFKGDRNYLHSTTMLDYLVERVIADRWIPDMVDFCFVKKTANKCEVLEQSSELDSSHIVAKYRDRHGSLVFFETDDPIVERVPFDEEAIIERCIEREDGMLVPNSIPSQYNFLERVIASYKHFLSIRYPDVPGAWAVARFTLDRIPTEEFRIRHDRRIAGAFFRSHILLDESVVGSMIFGKDVK